MTPHQIMNSVKDYLKGQNIERDDVIDLLALAFIIEENALLLGPPGTAKSKVISEFSALTRRTYFTWLMNKTTTPEELFGPYSIRELKNDRYVRITKAKLPDVQIAFLDEIGKSGSLIQNTLLRAINERVYDDGTGEKPIPLECLFGASNEMLDEPESQAFYDRFLFRIATSPISDSKFLSFLTMLSKKVTITPPTLAEENIIALRQSVSNVIIPDNILETLVKIKRKLSQTGINPSDRRWGKSLKIIQGNAALNGRANAIEEDFLPLVHVLVIDPKDHRSVKSTILEFTFPAITKALEIKDDALKLYEKYREDISNARGEEEKTAIHLTAMRKYKTMTNNINKIIGETNKNSEVIRIGEQISAFLEEITASALGNIA